MYGRDIAGEVELVRKNPNNPDDPDQYVGKQYYEIAMKIGHMVYNFNSKSAHITDKGMAYLTANNAV
jgi:hypothetical protein